MGRRLPKSKKHKKLKFVDPCYTGSGPCRKRNFVDNLPPTADDDQEAPRQAEEILNLKNKAKQGKWKKKKRRKVQKDDFIVVKNTIIDTNEHGMDRKVRKLPSEVRQGKFESQNNFFHRLQGMVNTAMSEAKIETKYNIDLVDVNQDGVAQYVAPRKKVSERKREKRKRQQEKVAEKKRLKKDDAQFDLKKEKVQFGDIVNAPPVFKARPRKAPELNKAGKRQLALKAMLPSVSSESGDNHTAVAPLSTKWKTLQPDKRKALESERLRAVQMYRIMKKKNAENCMSGIVT